MNIDEFVSQARLLFEDCVDELEKKAKDYQSGYPEALDSIFAEADELGVRPSWLIFVHMNKHFHAIKRFVRETHLDSEHIWSRLRDMANYCAIMQMVQKRENFIGSLASAGPSAAKAGHELQNDLKRVGSFFDHGSGFHRPSDAPILKESKFHEFARIPHVFQGIQTMCGVCHLARGAKCHHVDVRPPAVEPSAEGPSPSTQCEHCENTAIKGMRFCRECVT